MSPEAIIPNSLRRFAGPTKITFGVLVAIALAATIAACGSSSAKSDQQTSVDLLNSGLKAQAEGRTSDAVNDYKAAIAKDPKNKIAYYDLGLVQQQQGQLADAQTNYRAALLIDPKFTAPLFNLAIIVTATSPADARDYYSQVIAIQPNEAGPYLNRGFVYLQLGDKASAANDFAKAVQLDPSLAGRVPSAVPPAPAPSASPAH
jgi:tetratricopeptide (TPR) repeat protein